MATGTTCMEPAAADTTHAAPTTAPWAVSKQQAALLCLAAAAISGGLLWACYHPLGWGVLGWGALAPFLVLVRQARPRLLYFAAWLSGLLFFVPALQWMRVADDRMYITWFALAIYCSLYFPAALYGIRCLERWHVPLVLSVPLVWIALEYFRSSFLTGFSWYLLAHTQHDFLAMIQIADLGGVFLVSFLVAAVNAFLFDFAYQFSEIRQWFHQTSVEPYRYYASLEWLNRGSMAGFLFRRNLIVEGSILAILLAATYGYGVYRLNQEDFQPGPTVCLLQSNLDIRLRNDAAAPENDGHSQKTVRQHFAALCARASQNHHPRPDLLIWPETSYPGEWVEISGKFPIERVPLNWRDAEIDIRERLREFASTYTKVPHLMGMNANQLDENGRHRRYNSALLVNSAGRVEGRFDKMHRVPFGEYVPFGEWLPFMRALSPYPYEYNILEGEKFTRFQVNKHTFGVLICYEDTDPFLARNYLHKTADGAPVDFLVNMSNDGWFDGSSEHEEHLAVSRFRAIECRRALVRAANMGVSAVIDGNGRVLKPTLYPGTNPPVWVVAEEMLRIPELPTSEWHRFKGVEGIIKATVPIDQRFSFYTVAGDWAPVACWLVLLSAAGVSYLRRRPAAKKPALGIA